MRFSINKYFPFVLLLGMILAFLTACEEEGSELVTTGEPEVLYIRSTDPALSDSLLVGAFMGDLVAIIGENLGATREIWFNDQKATLNPAYITNETILVNVPSTVPGEVTDKIRFVSRDGSEFTHDFKVNVPGPVLSSIKSEFVPDGGIAVLYGDFFFEPAVVTFPDGLEAEIVSLDKTVMEVRVPDGASAGQISVKTNFGRVNSRFYFRDNRNTLLDFDNIVHETWTARIAGDGELAEIPQGVDGRFAYFKNDDFGAWQWVNEMTLQYWAPRGKGNVPLAAGSINDLVFKFECNVPIPWQEVRMEIFLGPYAEDHGRDVPTTALARWQPWANGPYTTDGWITVSIPLTDFKYGKDDPADNSVGSKSIENLSSLTNITMMLFGPADSKNPVLVAVDNVRIVQK